MSLIVFLFQIKRTLTPPSGWNEQYNLTRHKSLDELFEEREEDDGDLSFEMEEHYLKDVKNGFFIEAGASEGIIFGSDRSPRRGDLVRACIRELMRV